MIKGAEEEAKKKAEDDAKKKAAKEERVKHIGGMTACETILGDYVVALVFTLPFLLQTVRLPLRQRTTESK